MIITKTVNCDKTTVNNYKETAIDLAKKSSNRLTSILGKYKTVITPEGKQLDFTSNREWNKWCKTNTYVTDF